MYKKNTPVVILVGPTASGKSSLSMQLVQVLPLEIISVDSSMIYRGMDIGTAKPTAAELVNAPHRLIDIKNTTEAYSVGECIKDIQREINDVESQRKTPFLVGGTMMYFNALLKGLSDLPPANADIRYQLNKEAKRIGWPGLHAKLKKIDPPSFYRIQPNDAKRTQRALEVFLLTGETITEGWQLKRQVLTNPIILMAVAPPSRETLHERISIRWYDMIKAGLIQEVEALKQRGDLYPHLPSMRNIGYQQIWDYLTGKINQTTMHERAITLTRQLAKRQMTWLRSFDNLKWFDSNDPQLLVQVKNYICNCLLSDKQ